MWAIKNDTPYAAERSWTRGKGGEHHWIVAVKATFDLAPDGVVSLAREQVPPVLVPEYAGEPGSSSLLYDADLLAVKPATDVIAHGCAHAPRGEPAETVPVSMRVAGVRKVLVVHGLRLFYAGATGLATTRPLPFQKQAIAYEFAFGGADLADPDPAKHRIDPRNPVGKGFGGRPARLEGTPAHAIEYVDGQPDKAGPAGFGPIDRAWSPRLELAGTYDEAWSAKKKPLLPGDYDERHALCAPADQRPDGHLRGGEEVELVNLTPSGVLRFALPKHYFAFATFFGARSREHRAHLATVVLEPEKMRLMLVWQSSLLVPARDVEHLDRTVVFEKRYLR